MKLHEEFEQWVINYHFPDFRYDVSSSCYRRRDEVDPNTSLYVSGPELTGLMVGFLDSKNCFINPFCGDSTKQYDIRFLGTIDQLWRGYCLGPYDSYFEALQKAVTAVCGESE